MWFSTSKCSIQIIEELGGQEGTVRHTHVDNQRPNNFHSKLCWRPFFGKYAHSRRNGLKGISSFPSPLSAFSRPKDKEGKHSEDTAHSVSRNTYTKSCHIYSTFVRWKCCPDTLRRIGKARGKISIEIRPWCWEDMPQTFNFLTSFFIKYFNPLELFTATEKRKKCRN